MLNLVLNAVKFTDEGSITIKVSQADTPDDFTILFEVIDTGIGIAETDLESLFSEFTMVEASRARNLGGTGLGLAICKTLVDKMSGTIGVNSVVDSGSNFHFQLPLEPGTEQHMPKRRSFDENSAENRNLLDRELKVLVAEYNATNQLVISSYLERMNCVADVVGNGAEAVQAVKLGNYDVVLMDISMPEMNGLEATKAIRQLGGSAAKVPIVALTAYAMDEDRQRAIASGMNGYVAKPISRVDLANVLSRFASEESEIELSEDEALFDHAILSGILSGLAPERVDLIIAEFVRNVNDTAVQSQKAVNDNDLDALERATHSLRNAAGTFGATELHRLVSNIKDRCRTGEEIGDLSSDVSKMVDFAEKVAASVEQFHNSLTEGAKE